MLMIVGFGVSISQQANGSEAVVYYIPKILESGGIKDDDDQLQFTIMIGACRSTCSLLLWLFLIIWLQLASLLLGATL